MPRETIAGVSLTFFKTRLFKYIESHPGMSSGDLAGHFYSESNAGALSVRSHIYQINDALMGTGVKIRGSILTGYHVTRRK